MENQENMNEFRKKGKKLKYSHLMSCSHKKFINEDLELIYENNEDGIRDKMYSELEKVFMKYGLKEADLVYNLFNGEPLKESDTLIRYLHTDIFRKIN